MLKSPLKVHFRQVQIPAANESNLPAITIKVVEVVVAVDMVEEIVVEVEVAVVEVEVVATNREPIMLKKSAIIVARIIIWRMSAGTKTNHSATTARSSAIFQRIVVESQSASTIFS